MQWCVGKRADASFQQGDSPMSTQKVTKVMLAQRVRDLVAGTDKHPLSAPLTLGGQSFTQQALVQVLQSLGNALSTVDMAKASWQSALSDLGDTQAKVAPTLKAYRAWIVATYGNAPATLADFGLTPPKAPTPMTAEEKAAAVAKRTATRAARHTLGPKQKKGIKGAVATPVTALAPTPAPAPVAKPAS
jgi:hypothetical protein